MVGVVPRRNIVQCVRFEMTKQDEKAGRALADQDGHETPGDGFVMLRLWLPKAFWSAGDPGGPGSPGSQSPEVDRNDVVDDEAGASCPTSYAKKQKHISHAPRINDTTRDRHDRHPVTTTIATASGWPDCGHCGGCSSISDGNVVCEACHSIVSRWVDARAEWRVFGWEPGQGSNGGDKIRCASVTSSTSAMFQDASSSGTLGCYIPVPRRTFSAARSSSMHPLFNNNTASTNNANNNNNGVMTGDHVRSMMHKMQMWNSVTYRQRVMGNIFESLSLDAAQHRLTPCLLDDAKALYKRMAEAQTETKGEMRKAMMGASIYMACKRSGVPRSMREVSEICNTRPAALSKGYRYFQRMIENDVATSFAQDFVGRFCSRLDLDDVVTARIRKLVDRMTEAGVADNCTPPTLVAGVIRFVCENDATYRKKISRTAIADACKIAPATVTKSYNMVNADEHRHLR